MYKIILCLVVAIIAVHGKNIEIQVQATKEQIEKVPTTKEEIEEAHAALYAGGNFGGDMMLNEAQQSALKGGSLWPHFAETWPDGIIPYVIDKSIANKANIIRAAAAHIKMKTNKCIQFVPRTNEKDFVWMIYGTRGCWSVIGKQGGRQELHLGNGCGWFGIAVHELLHSVGLAHEQNRPDRDRYLNIYKQNIIQGQEYNFAIVDNGVSFTDFDYNSIMLYGEYAFSKQKGVLKTMEAKNKSITITEPYDKKYGMTKSDVSEVLNIYRCR